MTYFRMTAKSFNGNTIATKTTSTKPTMKEEMAFANRAAKKYGAHPQIVITQY